MLTSIANFLVRLAPTFASLALAQRSWGRGAAEGLAFPQLTASRRSKNAARRWASALMPARCSTLRRLRGDSHILGWVGRGQDQADQANAIGERVVRTLRQECLDYILPLSEGHMRSVLAEFVSYYNENRPPPIAGPGDSGAEPSPDRRRGGLSACPQRIAPRLRASRLTGIAFLPPYSLLPMTARVTPAAPSNAASPSWRWR